MATLVKKSVVKTTKTTHKTTKKVTTTTKTTYPEPSTSVFYNELTDHDFGTALAAMNYKNIETGTDTKCDIISCSLHKEGCTGALEDKRITMSADAPWKVSAKANVEEGYSVKFCIKCSNLWEG